MKRRSWFDRVIPSPMWAKVFGVLVAALMTGGLVAAPMASAETSHHGKSPTETTRPTESTTPTETTAPTEVTTPTEATKPVEVPSSKGGGEVMPMAQAQCPSGYVCAWSGENFTGNLSYWVAYQPYGCKNHAGNPNLRSGWSNSGTFYVRWGGRFTTAPYQPWSISGNPITGEICWGF